MIFELTKQTQAKMCAEIGCVRQFPHHQRDIPRVLCPTLPIPHHTLPVYHIYYSVFITIQAASFLKFYARQFLHSATSLVFSWRCPIPHQPHHLINNRYHVHQLNSPQSTANSLQLTLQK